MSTKEIQADGVNKDPELALLQEGFRTKGKPPTLFTRQGLNAAFKADSKSLVKQGQIPIFHSDLIRLQLTDNEHRYVEGLISQFSNEDLQRNIESGKVALILIRPHAENNSKGLPDQTVVDKIVERFESVGLTQIFQSSTLLTGEMVDEFIGHTEPNIGPELPTWYDGLGYVHTRYEEFKDLIQSGANTWVLFYSNDGSAIEKIRTKLGHWNMSNNPDETTVRGEFGLRDERHGRPANYTNLVHASDSPSTLIRELGILSRGYSQLLRT